MDIYFNLFLLIIIVLGFILLKYTANPYLYVGLILVSAFGFIFAVTTPLYYVDGMTTDIVYNGTIAIGSISGPIKIDMSTYDWVMQVFYMMTLIGSIIYWAYDNRKEQDEDYEYDD